MDKAIYNYQSQFWTYLVAMTILLSLPLCLFCSSGLLAVLLIIASYAFVNIISCRLAPCNIKLLCFFTWLFGGVFNFLDIWIIASLNLVDKEPFPLILSQVYIIPIGAVYSGLICLVGAFVLKLSIRNKSNEI